MCFCLFDFWFSNHYNSLMENNKETMNIVLCTDGGYVEPCCTAIESVINNNPCFFVIAFIIVSDLPPEKKCMLSDYATRTKARSDIRIIEIDKSLLEKCSVRIGGYWSIATYYRLFLPSILPESINKVLYIDCDVVCVDSLEDFYKTELTEKACAVVHDDEYEERFNLLGYDSHLGYFNAGVMLINLDYWKSHDIQQKALTFALENQDKCVWYDQDALNFTLRGNVMWVDFRYNTMQGFFFEKKYMKSPSEHYSAIDEAAKNPAILHFCSRYKPWHKECVHPRRAIYAFYYQQAWGRKLKLSHRLKGVELLKWLIKRTINSLGIKKYEDFKKSIFV